MYLTKNIKEKCVMARVTRRKKLHQRDFTLKKYRTWERAEHAAGYWIEKILPELPPKSSNTGLMTRRNHSGIVGVHWSAGIVKKRNGETYKCPRWIAKWPGCPHRGGISWTEKEYEHEGAFVLAALSRELKTVNRDKILAEFELIRHIRRYREIVKKMRN